MYIESQQNPKVREWSRLKTKKSRQESGMFIVEGYRLVEEVLKSSFVVSAILWNVGEDELTQEIQDAALELGVPIYELSPNAFLQVSDTITPQGVIAIVSMPETTRNRKPILSEQALVLDGLQDPGNVGTLLRTADAFGIGEVCCGSSTVDPFSPKVVRASMGGLFRVPTSTLDTVAYIDMWKKQHPEGRVFLTSATAKNGCHEVSFKGPYLLVIGSEAFGVSEEARDFATDEVKIPMTGVTESLNAAVAGSVLLYEAFRQQQ